MTNIARTAMKGVTYYDPDRACNGYTLFCVDRSLSDWRKYEWTDVLLVDMEGYVVNHWRLPVRTVCHGRLLPNGNYIYPTQGSEIDYWRGGNPGMVESRIGRCGVAIVQLDWDGQEVFRQASPYVTHDFYPFDCCPYDMWPHNGHTMYIAYPPDHLLSRELTSKWKGGRVGDEWDGKIVSGTINEVDSEGRLVWQCVLGEVFDPEMDWIPPTDTRTHFHTNGIGLCPDGNIVISCRSLSRVYKIEYPTGKILRRYGENEIFHPHDPEALDNGNILVFDNGSLRSGYGPCYSRSIEFDGESGEIVWEYKADPPSVFYGPYQSGNERLPNGNTLINTSKDGHIFEVTHDGEIVWEYMIPLMSRTPPPATNGAFRAHRYPKDYPAFKGRDLDPGRFPWENRVWGPQAWKREFKPCIF